MKSFLFTLISCFGITFSCYSQHSNIKLTEIKDKEIITMLASVDTLIIKSTDHLIMYIYNIENGYGSAKSKGTDEITNKILVAVSDGDDAPEQHLYLLGNFFDPNLTNIHNLTNGHFLIDIEYGTFNYRKKLTYDISLRKVTIQK